MVILPLIRPFNFSFTLFHGLNPKRKKNPLGKVKFSENNICINHKRNTIHYEVSKLLNLEIHGGLFWEYNPLKHAFNNDRISRRKHTGKTKIILRFSDKIITIHFQINSNKEFEGLIEVLVIWYNSKQFKIKESHLGKERMLLLDPYHTYESIQTIKEKIGIESMYE